MPELVAASNEEEREPIYISDKIGSGTTLDIALKLNEPGQLVELRQHFPGKTEVLITKMARADVISLLTEMGFNVVE